MPDIIESQGIPTFEGHIKAIREENNASNVPDLTKEKESVDQNLKSVMSEQSLFDPELFDSYTVNLRTSKRTPKTKETNKLRSNMKSLLNLTLKKDVVIGIEDSLDEEDPKSKRVEEMLTGVLETNDEVLKKLSYLLEGRNLIKENIVKEDA